jgi:xylulose-5-phosphate/fructose-6-phosphate phosphoketolase
MPVSHINAETPGAIHEGGELGYALAVSFGAVMDNPDLIVTCIVGDGEAETGPTAAWVCSSPCHRAWSD